jgi:hypothetical protein
MKASCATICAAALVHWPLTTNAMHGPRRTSSGVKTSLNVLKLSLAILRETPIPGIGAAAEALSQVLNRTQVSDELQWAKGELMFPGRSCKTTQLAGKISRTECSPSHSSVLEIMIWILNFEIVLRSWSPA